MLFPTQVLFRFIDKNQIPIPNLIVFFELLASSKNNYSLGRFITSEKGEISLSKKLINNKIQKAMKEYPMDYNCLLVNCKDVLQVIIEDWRTISVHVQNLAKFYPKESDNLNRLLSRSVNESYKNQTLSIEVNESMKDIAITIDRKLT